MVILAIACHTFRDAIRKKVLHVLIGLGILIMVITPFIPTSGEPDARLKMVFVVFFQVVLVLCNIGIIFLSAISLPREIEDKTIFGILSKPVSRMDVIVGKITGFAFLSALLLAILSLLNIVVIQYAASGIPTEHRGILKAREEFKPSNFSIRGKIHHARGGIAWIEGEKTGVAVWSFTDVNKKEGYRYSPEVELNLKLESSKGFTDVIPLMIGMENPVTGQGIAEVVPAKLDESLTLHIDPAIIQKSDTVNISVFPVLKTDYMGVTPEDVKIFSAQKGFASNYAKAAIITFFKFLLIVIIAVMGSTYLSAPVNIVSALVVFLCGHVLDFMKDFSLLIEHYDIHEHILPAAQRNPGSLLIYVDYLIKKPLEWITFILPDFKRFDCLKFILNGVYIPSETMRMSIGYTAVYAGICLLISSLILRKREFF